MLLGIKLYCYSRYRFPIRFQYIQHLRVVLWEWQTLRSNPLYISVKTICDSESWIWCNRVRFTGEDRHSRVMPRAHRIFATMADLCIGSGGVCARIRLKQWFNYALNPNSNTNIGNIPLTLLRNKMICIFESEQ